MQLMMAPPIFISPNARLAAIHTLTLRPMHA
jgi:hypothetical protein